MFRLPEDDRITSAEDKQKCQSVTVNPSLGHSLTEARLCQGTIDQLLEVEDEHDDDPFLVFHGDHVHRARSARPFKHRDTDISDTFALFVCVCERGYIL